MTHPLHRLLLTIHHLVRLLLVNVALKVVLVIRLPRLRTHVAKRFAASAGHEVATHRSLHRLLTPRTDLSVGSNPLSISFLRNDLLNPFALLVTFARIVVIALTPETKNLSANTLDSINIDLIHLNTVSTVHPRAKLIIPILHDQQLAHPLSVLLQN